MGFDSGGDIMPETPLKLNLSIHILEVILEDGGKLGNI